MQQHSAAGLRIPLPGFLTVAVVASTAGIAWLILSAGAEARLKEALFDANATSHEKLQSIKYWVAQGSAAVPELKKGLTNPHPKVRMFSAYSLALIGSEAESALPALQACFNDHDAEVRAHALDAAFRVTIDKSAMYPAALELFSDEADTVREVAADILQEQGLSVVPSLLPLAESSAVDQRVATALLLARVAAFEPDVQQVLVKLLQDGSPTVREAAYAGLARAKAVPTSALVRGIHDESSLVVDVCLAHPWRSRWLYAPDTAIQLLKLLNDAQATRGRQIQIVRILGSLRQSASAAVPTLVSLTQHRSQRMRTAALLTLAEIPTFDPQTTPLPLEELAIDPSRDVTRALGSVLRRKVPSKQRNEFATAAIERLSHPDPAIRRTAVALLNGLGSSSALVEPALLAALEDEDPRVRFEAISACGHHKPASPQLIAGLLAQLGNTAETDSNQLESLLSLRRCRASSEDVLPVVSAALPAWADDSAELYAAGIQYLGRQSVTTPDFVELVLQLARSEGEYLPRGAALRAISRLPIEKETKLEVLESGLYSDSHVIRLSSLIGLANWGRNGADLASDVAPMLHDPDMPIRWAAARCLARMGSAAEHTLPDLDRALADHKNYRLPVGESDAESDEDSRHFSKRGKQNRQSDSDSVTAEIAVARFGQSGRMTLYHEFAAARKAVLASTALASNSDHLIDDTDPAINLTSTTEAGNRRPKPNGPRGRRARRAEPGDRS